MGVTTQLRRLAYTAVKGYVAGAENSSWGFVRWWRESGEERAAGAGWGVRDISWAHQVPARWSALSAAGGRSKSRGNMPPSYQFKQELEEWEKQSYHRSCLAAHWQWLLMQLIQKNQVKLETKNKYRNKVTKLKVININDKWIINFSPACE